MFAAFHTWHALETEFKGRYLFNAGRIMAMTCDVRKHLVSHSEDKAQILSKNANCINNQKETLISDAQIKCLDGLAALVPHHCGNPNGCQEDSFHFCKIWGVRKAKLKEGESVDYDKVACKYTLQHSRFGDIIDFDERDMSK